MGRTSPTSSMPLLSNWGMGPAPMGEPALGEVTRCMGLKKNPKKPPHSLDMLDSWCILETERR